MTDISKGGRQVDGVAPTVMTRELDLKRSDDGQVEYWQLSQSGLRIMYGSQKTALRDKNVVRWIEDPSTFQSEKDIFDFIKVDYLEPSQRCA